MKSLISWLILMFMAMFWIFRITVTLSSQFSADSNFAGFIVFNETAEILLLFLSLLCFALFARRIIWGAIIYTVAYGWYFGSYLVNTLMPALSSEEPIDPVILENSFVAALGIILGLIAVLNIAYEKTKTKHFSDNKTDWYFDNEKYDREMDERADKNQYRTF